MSLKRPVSFPLAQALNNQDVREKAVALVIGVGVAIALGVVLA